jgi:hypothetical protein
MKRLCRCARCGVLGVFFAGMVGALSGCTLEDALRALAIALGLLAATGGGGSGGGDLIEVEFVADFSTGDFSCSSSLGVNAKCIEVSGIPDGTVRPDIVADLDGGPRLHLLGFDTGTEQLTGITIGTSGSELLEITPTTGPVASMRLTLVTLDSNVDPTTLPDADTVIAQVSRGCDEIQIFVDVLIADRTDAITQVDTIEQCTGNKTEGRATSKTFEFALVDELIGGIQISVNYPSSLVTRGVYIDQIRTNALFDPTTL